MKRFQERGGDVPLLKNRNGRFLAYLQRFFLLLALILSYNHVYAQDSDQQEVFTSGYSTLPDGQLIHTLTVKDLIAVLKGNETTYYRPSFAAGTAKEGHRYVLTWPEMQIGH